MAKVYRAMVNGAKELLITEGGRFANVLGGPGGYLEAQKFVP